MVLPFGVPNVSGSVLRGPLVVQAEEVGCEDGLSVTVAPRGDISEENYSRIRNTYVDLSISLRPSRDGSSNSHQNFPVSEVHLLPCYLCNSIGTP